MSIMIKKDKCISCGKCMEVCPGNLIKADENNKAYIKFSKSCWGCASCIKECNVNAIQYFLGADIGGTGTTISTKTKGDITNWTIGDTEIEVDKKNSNAY